MKNDAGINTDQLRRCFAVLRAIDRHNRAGPIKGEAIEEATGVDSRVVAKIVSVAAEMGVQVGSCSDGYFKTTPKDTREYLAREKSRLISLGKKISGVKRNADNPLSLFEQI
jgi:hypothetical protein